jgi:DNA-binding MarR family transcriptional regulator
MNPTRQAVETAHLIDRLERLTRSGELSEGLNPAQWEALRYLARANRFSRTPAALADYLGSTRGTVSQTLIALEQKGRVARSPSKRDGRSIMLTLTPHGERALRHDPILALAADLAAADGADLGRVAESLRSALGTAIARNGGRPFGACHTCLHFRNGSGATSLLPHHCALLDEPLSRADSRCICIEQVPAPALNPGAVTAMDIGGG